MFDTFFSENGNQVEVFDQEFCDVCETIRVLHEEFYFWKLGLIVDKYGSKPDLPGVRDTRKCLFMAIYKRLYYCHVY
jgi:hypothetical protein